MSEKRKRLFTDVNGVWQPYREEFQDMTANEIAEYYEDGEEFSVTYKIMAVTDEEFERLKNER